MTQPIVYVSDIIYSHLKTLDALLTEAARYATEALGHLQANQQNTVIGSLLPVEDLLTSAIAIHKVILLLHTHKVPGRNV